METFHVDASEKKTPDSLKICDVGYQSDFPANKTIQRNDYTSPENIKEDECTQSTDIWSLGVLLSLMLDEKLPYKTTPFDTPQKMVNNMKVLSIVFSSKVSSTALFS